LDVIKSYCQLREMVDAYLPISRVPQLLLTGFGSIDDPEGQVVYEEVLEYIEQDDLAPYAHDILSVKLPPSDQLMGALLQKAYVALQLSIREGFEIKVTEAISKGVPVIVYNTGGLPKQVRDGKSGYVVESGDTARVANLIADLLSHPDKYAAMRDQAQSSLDYQLCSPFQATNWLWLINHLLNSNDGSCVGRECAPLSEKVVEKRGVGNFWSKQQF
jgi:glycosyltransferase involved in cell wall biosynthesis